MTHRKRTYSLALDQAERRLLLDSLRADIRSERYAMGTSARCLALGALYARLLRLEPMRALPAGVLREEAT